MIEITCILFTQRPRKLKCQMINFFLFFTTKQHLIAQGDSRPATTKQGVSVTDSNFRRFIKKLLLDNLYTAMLTRNFHSCILLKICSM
jgi:hypothetical protein